MVRGNVLAFAAMFVGGCVWVLGMTSLNVSAQIAVPHWVTGRALARYQLLVQGIAFDGLIWWCKRSAKQHFDDAECSSALHDVQSSCGAAFIDFRKLIGSLWNPPN